MRVTRESLVIFGASIAALGILSLLPGDESVVHVDFLAVVSDRSAGHQKVNHGERLCKLLALARPVPELVVISCLNKTFLFILLVGK